MKIRGKLVDIIIDILPGVYDKYADEGIKKFCMYEYSKHWIEFLSLQICIVKSSERT